MIHVPTMLIAGACSATATCLRAIMEEQGRVTVAHAACDTLAWACMPHSPTSRKMLGRIGRPRGLDEGGGCGEIGAELVPDPGGFAPAQKVHRRVDAHAINPWTAQLEAYRRAQQCIATRRWALFATGRDLPNGPPQAPL